MSKTDNAQTPFSQELATHPNWEPEVGEAYVSSGNYDALDYDSALSEAGSYEDDWPLVEKIDLVGVPFVILAVHAFEGMGESGKAYNVRVVAKNERTKAEERISFNCGGSGVYDQLNRIFSSMENARPILVKGGLRISRFHWSEEEQRVTTDGTPNTACFYLCSSIEQAKKSLTK